MEDINRDWKKAEMLTSTLFKEIFIWHDIRSEDAWDMPKAPGMKRGQVW